jgi:thiol-disulfide isomerase/thioredoxin
MRSALLVSSLAIANAYVATPSARMYRGLNYKTHEYEYGEADDRVRTLTSDDRVSVLEVLETDVVVKKRSSMHLHQEDNSSSTFSQPQAPAQPLTPDIWLDVDMDRFSLASLLEPPAAPFVREDNAKTATQSRKQVTSRMIKKSSTITPLASIEDFNQHILSSDGNDLKLIRFSAPWCQVCRTTNVAFDRMSSKLAKGGDVQFYSVLIDSNKPEDAKNLLKDHLEVNAVPTGVLYHPSKGIIGRVNLNRANMGELKKRLDGYVSGALHRQGEMMWMEALVMGLEVGDKKL